MAQRSKLKEVSFKEISQSLNDNFTGADKMRCDGIEQLLKVRKAKENVQARELKRVREKYGAKDPRSTNLKFKLLQNERLVRELKREGDRAKTDMPAVDENSWVVYGYVRDRQLEPLEGLTLGMYTAEGNFVDKFGTTTTDKRGYFEFRYTQKKKTVAAGTEKPQSELSGAKSATKAERLGKARITHPNAVFIQVSGKGVKKLHADKRSLIPRTGTVDYRDIIIPDGAVKKTRYLGNSHTRELHDLKKEHKNCRIQQIRLDHRINFKTQKEALKAGYDFCAYCFSKDKSKR